MYRGLTKTWGGGGQFTHLYSLGCILYVHMVVLGTKEITKGVMPIATPLIDYLRLLRLSCLLDPFNSFDEVWDL